MFARMEDYYDLIEAGEFEDGAKAFRLQVKGGFKIHDEVVPVGIISMFRIDENSELRASWLFGEGDIRSSQIDSTIIGSLSRKMDDPCVVSNSRLSSCNIQTRHLCVKHVDLNDVNSAITIRFFGAMGAPEDTLILSKVNYGLSVRMFNTNYSEFKKFTDQYVRE